jgi:hypothetical protein
MKTVRSEIAFKERASRIEILVRLVYWIPLVIVLWVLSAVAGFVEIVQLLHILLLGRRHPTLNKFLSIFVKFQFQINAYYSLTTDERPPIIPENK